MNTKQEAFDNAMNYGDFYEAAELAENMNMKNGNTPIGYTAGVDSKKYCFAAWEEQEELIPCGDELSRLKEFLLNLKRDRYEGERVPSTLTHQEVLRARRQWRGWPRY